MASTAYRRANRHLLKRLPIFWAAAMGGEWTRWCRQWCFTPVTPPPGWSPRFHPAPTKCRNIPLPVGTGRRSLDFSCETIQGVGDDQTTPTKRDVRTVKPARASEPALIVMGRSAGWLTPVMRLRCWLWSIHRRRRLRRRRIHRRRLRRWRWRCKATRR